MTSSLNRTRLVFLASLSLPFGLQAGVVVDSEPLVVSSSRLQAESIAGHITTISAEQIQSSTARDIPSLLNREAGIAVRGLYGNGTRTSIDLRGFGETGTQNTLILLNGRRLNDVDLSAINYATIPLESIERIEISRGSGAVLYGDGAVAGTVNIITSRPSVGETGGFLKYNTGSYDQQALHGYWFNQTDRLGLVANLNQAESDGYRDNNHSDQTSGRLDVSLPFGSSEWFLKLGSYQQALELPGVRTVDPGLNLNQLKNDRRGTSNPNDWADEETEFFTVGVSQEHAPGVESVIDLGLRDKTQEAQFDYGFGFGDFNRTHVRTWSLTPRLTVDHQLFGDKAQSRVGFDLYDHEYDSSRSNFKQNIHQPIHVLDIHQRSLAVYGQTLWAVSDVTDVDLGLRLQRVSIDAKDTADPAAPGAFFPTEAADYDQTDTEHVIELGVSHQWRPSVSLFARTGRSVRFSNVDELFEFNDLFVQVFSPLKPQTAHLFELGMNYQRGPVDFTASLYRMDLRNEIHFLPSSFQNINLDDTRRSGIELNLNRSFGDLGSVQTNYSYTRSEFVDGPFKDQRVPLVPAHQANVIVTFNLNPETTLSTTWSYVGSSYFANDLSNRFGQKIPDYQTVDVKLAKTIQAFTLTAAVTNLFDASYYSFGVNSTATPGRYNAYPMPERQWMLSVEYAL